MGFWSSLAKIGGAVGGIALAPFTGGASTLLTSAALGLGASGAAGLFSGNKKADSGNPTQTQYTPYTPPEMTDEMKQLLASSESNANTGDTALKSGINTFGTALNTLAQPKSYYSSLLSGDRNKMMDVLGPEIDTILGQYDSAAKASANISPRSGGTAAVLAEAPYQKIGAIANLLPQARVQAASGLTNIAGQEGNIAASEANLGANLAGNRTALLSTLLSNQQAQSSQGLQDKALQLQLQEFLQQLKQNKSLANQQILTDLGTSIGSLLVDIFKK